MQTRVLGVVGGVVAAISCTDLPDIEPGACGNGVVEAGEDCDTFDQGAHVCRKDGERACRFVCSTDPELPGSPCPDGWGCGDDGTCRKASGSFAAWGETIEWPTRQIFVADFDGDLQDDVLTVADDVLVASFFDESGSIEAETVLFIDQARPAVGELSAEVSRSCRKARASSPSAWSTSSARSSSSSSTSARAAGRSRRSSSLSDRRDRRSRGRCPPAA
jgi:hypothetical protein